MSSRSVDRFSSAQYRMQAARHSLDGGFSGVAVAETYYAMADIVRGALQRKNIQTKTHSGLETMFYKQFVDDGPIAKSRHRTFVQAYEARWRWHYRSIEPSISTVERYLDIAAALLDQLRE